MTGSILYMKKDSHHTKESIEKMKRNYNSPWSNERREKMREFMKGNTYGFKKGNHPKSEFKKGYKPWNKDLKRVQIAWNKNIPCSIEMKARISNKLTGRKLSRKTRSNMKKGQQIRYSNPTEKERMVKILSKSWRKKDTLIERIIEAELKTRGILFEKQYQIFSTITDFFVPKYNLAIYCDGIYWHSLPKVKERDKKYTQLLEKNGYWVVRLVGTDIRKNSSKCIDSLNIG